jgi:hypothetical protein
VTKARLVLPDELAAHVLLAAAHAYPNEACGLLEGRDAPDGWIATLHMMLQISPKTRRAIS